MSNTQISVNGYNMKIRDNGDSTYSTTTSKVVQATSVISALPITDTANHDSSVLDVSTFENVSIFVCNLLNQAVTVQVLIIGPDGTSTYNVTTTKSVASNTSYLVSSVDIPVLTAPFTKMKVRLYCTTAPTSGTVYAWVEGY